MTHEGSTGSGSMDSQGEPLNLISAAADGDMAAFEHLYRRYSPRIFGLCLRLTGQREAAEDCTQETFVDAWRALFKFEGRSSFSTWLHSIAIRTVLSRRRGLRQKFEVAEPAGGLPEQIDPAADGPPLDLERAIAALPEAARHVLVLVGLYGFSHAEAAANLRIAEGTCKAQLHRARQLLSQALELEVS
jgi:RNA polymerase sigma-70 factor, ECF subfamily